MNAPLLQIQPPGAHRPKGLAVFRLGFRPFYICAAMLAVVHVGWWASIATGIAYWPGYMPPLLWHAHEMLFGFAAAVITGFLFTAGKNWTQIQTPRGPVLAALVFLWLAARGSAVYGTPELFMTLDLAFLPAVALILLRVLLLGGNRKNVPLVGILLLLAAANLAFHLSATGVIATSALQLLHAALGLVVTMELIMAGRVIPGFTNSALPSVRIIPSKLLDRLCIAISAFGLALWAAQIVPSLSGCVLMAASLINTIRLLRWQSWQCMQIPMLWILHAAYLWFPVGLILLALSEWGVVATSLGVHALAVGATGGLIIGMITRTARGHTGRNLMPSGFEKAAFVLLLAAAFVRVVPLLLWPETHTASVLIAALFWCGAFGLYLWIYVPWLFSDRIDGRDG